LHILYTKPPKEQNSSTKAAGEGEGYKARHWHVSGPRLRNSLTKARQGTGKALARVRPKVKEFLNQGKALARVRPKVKEFLNQGKARHW
jgi:hypothetical protein